MKYESVWSAVDKLAQSRGLSPSGLAKLAGLDATTFNKSKRLRPDGKKRWPSLDSINKLLDVCNISFEEFYNINNTADSKDHANSISFIKYSTLNEKQNFINKNLDISGWNKVIFPDNKDSLYAIEIDNNDCAPMYRYGSMIVVANNSDIRRGDRVIVFKQDGSMSINEFIRRTATNLVLSDINDMNKENNLQISNVKLIHRIVWVSQ